MFGHVRVGERYCHLLSRSLMFCYGALCPVLVGPSGKRSITRMVLMILVP